MKLMLMAMAAGALLFCHETEAGTETVAPDNDCTNPVFVTSATNGGWSDGGYYVHNNMWNASTGETLFACAYNHWRVTANYPDTTDVKTYPNVHKDIAPAVSLDHYHSITSTFAATSPHVGIYDVAYDIWLNGVATKGTTEFMIWTENHKQVPLGKIQGKVSFDGTTYDAWHYAKHGNNVITLVPRQAMTSGKLNLKSMFDWAISKQWMPANPTINQICYGVEICSTQNQPATFYFTNFSVTTN